MAFKTSRKSKAKPRTNSPTKVTAKSVRREKSGPETPDQEEIEEVEEEVEEEIAQPSDVAEKKSGPGYCVECGEPVAPGQTYVCIQHVRYS